MESNKINMENSYIFHVEQDSDWLVFNIDFKTNYETWSVFLVRDSLGRLRYQHLDVNRPSIVILHQDPFKTSLNGVAGNIPAGEWRIDFVKKPDFNLYFEFGKGSLPYKYQFNTADPAREIWAIDFDSKGHFLLSGYDWERNLESGSRWYKGDCHMHTIQSDGNLTPDQLNRQAQESGLDFIVITDHFISPTSWPKTDLLVIPGIEITASGGHWNVLGLKKWVDWNPNSPDGGIASEEGMNRIIQDASDSGAICAINHPMYEPWEWTFHQTNLNKIDAIEIINAPYTNVGPAAAEQALKIWDALWNEGYRIAGIGGSDFHGGDPCSSGINQPRIGNPTTCVYAHQLSAKEILDNICARHVYVTMDPAFELSIQVDGKVFLPGDDLTEVIQASIDGMVHCQLSIRGMASGKLYWIENGKRVLTMNIDGEGVFETSFEWKGANYSWARVEIHSVDGDLMGFTNPFSYGSKTPEALTWAQIVNKAGLKVLDLKLPNIAGW